MPQDPVELIAQYRVLQSQRSAWETDWRELARYILPRKSSAIGRKPTQGEKQTVGLFDSTAIHANNLLGAALQGSVTSNTTRWFRLRMRNELLNREASVDQWLQECSNRIYSALQQSNWTAEQFEVYLDLGAFGTGAMYMTERDTPVTPAFRGFLFRSIPIGTYVIAEDADGRVDTIMYEFDLSARAAVSKWGPTVGDRITALAQAKPAEPVTFVHAVYPRAGGRYGGPQLRKPWASCWLSEKDKRIVAESGYDLFPFAVPRWTKASGEMYGRGPGHTSLPDIKTLNRLVEMELSAIALAIKPPLGARDHGVIGSIRWTPGGVTTLREKDALIPFETGAKFQVGQVKAEQLKTGIRDMFYNSQLQLPTNQPQTATEIERRYELMNRILGPTLGRLEFEDSIPVVTWAFATMLKRGALPPPPALLQAAAQTGDDHLDVVAEGPLARAQKGSDVLAAERTLQIVLPMANVDPDVLDEYDLPEVARIIGEAAGMPATAFRSTQDIAQRRSDRAQAQQEAKQSNQMTQMATAAGKAAPLLSVLQGGTKASTTAPPGTVVPGAVTPAAQQAGVPA